MKSSGAPGGHVKQAAKRSGGGGGGSGSAAKATAPGKLEALHVPVLRLNLEWRLSA